MKNAADWTAAHPDQAHLGPAASHDHYLKNGGDAGAYPGGSKGKWFHDLKKAKAGGASSAAKPAAPDSGWRTLHGAHVHFGADGKIDKGPAHMVGHASDSIPSTTAAASGGGHKHANAAAFFAANPAATKLGASASHDAYLADGGDPGPYKLGSQGAWYHAHKKAKAGAATEPKTDAKTDVPDVVGQLSQGMEIGPDGNVRPKARPEPKQEPQDGLAPAAAPAPAPKPALEIPATRQVKHQVATRELSSKGNGTETHRMYQLPGETEWKWPEDVGLTADGKMGPIGTHSSQRSGKVMATGKLPRGTKVKDITRTVSGFQKGTSEYAVGTVGHWRNDDGSKKSIAWGKEQNSLTEMHPDAQHPSTEALERLRAAGSNHESATSVLAQMPIGSSVTIPVGYSKQTYTRKDEDTWTIYGTQAASHEDVASKIAGANMQKASVVIPKGATPAPSATSTASATPTELAVVPDVAHEQIGGQGGSNPGGMYRGKDGVERYVKHYSDPAQAVGEATANTIYRALGINAPASAVSRRADGGLSFASERVPAFTELGKTGITPALAKHVLDGVAADMLLANWDVVGLVHDNIGVTKDGEVHRIDNGSAFLHRAQAGRKPAGALHGLSEAQVFFDASKNPSYAKLAKTAGYATPTDVPSFRAQVEKISELAAKTNNWADVIPAGTPGVSAADRATMISMLQHRTAALKDLAGK